MKQRFLSVARAVWDRKVRSGILIAIIVGAFTMAGGTGFNETPKAQADNCHAEQGTWVLKSAGITVARVTFGATVCEDNGEITGVTPIFEGDTEGAGDLTGWKFSSGGVWVESSGAHGFVVKAESSAKLCSPLGRLLPCSLTDRQTYRLAWYNTMGPYLVQPGFRLRSNTHFLGGGDAPQITFEKVG